MLRPDEQEALAHVSGPIVAVGDDGGIAFANLEALALLGWDNLTGRPLSALIPARLLPSHQKGFSRYVQSGESHLQGATVRVPARRQDGTESEIDLTIRVWRRPDGSKFVAAAMSQVATGKPPEHLRFIEGALQKRMYELI